MIHIIHEHAIEDLLVNSCDFGLVVIEFHLLHFLSQSFSCVVSSLLIFLFLLCLLFSLNSFEFVEHILVVKDCVGELILEVIFIQ